MESFDPYDGDPVLRACVERAMEPYRHLPAEQLVELRNFLIVHATTHPAIAPLYENLRNRADVDRSGTAPVGAEAPRAKRRAANDE